MFAYKCLHRLSICAVDLLRAKTKLMIPGLDYSLKHMMFFHFRLQLWVAHFLLTGVVLQLLKHYFVFLFMLPFPVPLLVTHLSCIFQRNIFVINCSCMCIAEKIKQQGTFGIPKKEHHIDLQLDVMFCSNFESSPLNLYL